MNYRNLTPQLIAQIKDDHACGRLSPYRCNDDDALVEHPSTHIPPLPRSHFVRDVDKILHSPYYNRYTNKTQVFSHLRNDDVTRRALHVQIVSRIARTIGANLGLNVDLIEAIALGHDIGHTPFGHAGERYLSALLHAHNGTYFNHNVQSARVLYTVFPQNISLQTLSGVLCHNGEFEQQEYHPAPLATFQGLAREIEQCTHHSSAIDELVPSTLEGCVVRVCDIIAYLGKDRQDAERIAANTPSAYQQRPIGTTNPEIINNLTVNIIENSYGKDHLCMDRDYFLALKEAKRENYQHIYSDEAVNDFDAATVQPMFERLFTRFLDDLLHKSIGSYIYRHHIDFVNARRVAAYTRGHAPYLEATAPPQIVADYLASMTDTYFIDLHAQLYPNEPTITYRPYFD